MDGGRGGTGRPVCGGGCGVGGTDCRPSEGGAANIEVIEYALLVCVIRF